MDDVVFFDGPAAWRAWLEEHHATAPYVLVGFYKVGTGKATMTWPESVDEALCFGSIDGHRKGIDAERYTIRFTPRRARSNWSAINVARVAELEALGRMQPPGRAAFEGRTAKKTGTYSYEQRGQAALEPDEEAFVRADAAAWTDWERRPPHYRKSATWWIVSARRPDTRRRRLETLVACCAAGQNVPPFVVTKKK